MVHSREIGVAEIVLERDLSLIDREVVFLADLIRPKKSRLTFRHVEPHSEPLLWISDAIGWAYHRGGDWKRRATSLPVTLRNVG